MASPLEPWQGTLAHLGRELLDEMDALERELDREHFTRVVRLVERTVSYDRPVPLIPDRESMGPDLIGPLTTREQEVLALLAHRFSNKEIADTLCVSWQTVAKHAYNIYQKLCVTSRREAVERAAALGILPVGDGLGVCA